MKTLAIPVAGLALVVLGVACSDPPPSDLAAVLDALPQATATSVVEPAGPTATTTTSPSQRDCEARDLATASLRPDATARAGTGPTIDAIRDREQLRVGVDENTLGLAFLDTETGDIEGFEVELAREIAARIFGDDDDRVELVPVVTDEKFRFVENREVDMTISANSMTCARWEDVAFSSAYYTAHQQFLVRTDSPIETADDLAGTRVCVTEGSTSYRLLRKHVPDAEPVEVADRTGCLVLLQEGQVDAYYGHDTFIYGLMNQDPTVEPLDFLPATDFPDTDSHYGIAINREQPDLVRFVNAVLEDLRTDGTWDELHEQLEDDISVPDATPPAADYRSEG